MTLRDRIAWLITAALRVNESTAAYKAAADAVILLREMTPEELRRELEET